MVNDGRIRALFNGALVTKAKLFEDDEITSPTRPTINTARSRDSFPNCNVLSIGLGNIQRCALFNLRLVRDFFVH